MKLFIKILVVIFLLSSCNPKKTDTESMSLSSENADIMEITPEIEFLIKNFDNYVIDGSTTMIPLHQSLAGRFNSKNNIIEHSKTVEAFEKFLEGKTHILFSVDYSDELLNKAKDKGIILAKKEITKEGFVFLINKNNKVKNLTAEQIKDIYSDKIKNWKEVGGDNMPIKAYQRNRDSGSQIRMLKFMGEHELTNDTFNYISSSMSQIIKVLNDYDTGKYSIGYNMYTFTKKQYPSENVVFLAVNGINPTDETIFNETYPIVIHNYIFYDSNNAIVSEFVEKLYSYLMTDEGQKLISDSGYINLNKQYDRNLNIYNPYVIETRNDYVNIDWWNKEKNEFYDFDERTNDILIFNNYADYKLHKTKFSNNKNARDFLTLVINSNYEVANHTIWVDEKGKEISFSFWWDAELTLADFFNIRYNNKYYIGIDYYPDEDKYVLRTYDKNTFNDHLIYNYDNLIISEEQKNNVANSDVEIKREDLKKIYFRSRNINKVSKEYDYNLLF